MKVEARIHIAGKKSKAKTLDVRPGRKLIPGERTRFGGLLYRVLGFGYEAGKPVVHISR